MGRRLSARGIRKHRIYRVDEAARAIGCCKETVRRWIQQGLPAIADQKPVLLRGSDIQDFLSSRKAHQKKCALDQCYCVRCRAPRRPVMQVAFISINRAGRPELRGPCEACGTSMLKPVKRADAKPLATLLAASAKQAV